MKWSRVKPVEPTTVGQARAQPPELSDETAQALESVITHRGAQRATYRELPLGTRFGLWWSNDAYPNVRMLFKGTLLVLGWFSVFDWIDGQDVLDYVLRGAWLVVGLAAAGLAMESEE